MGNSSGRSGGAHTAAPTFAHLQSSTHTATSTVQQHQHQHISQPRPSNLFLINFHYNLVNLRTDLTAPHQAALYLQTIELWCKGVLVIPPRPGYRSLSTSHTHNTSPIDDHQPFIDIFSYRTNHPAIQLHTVQPHTPATTENTRMQGINVQQLHQLSLMQLASAQQREWMLDALVDDQPTITKLMQQLKQHVSLHTDDQLLNVAAISSIVLCFTCMLTPTMIDTTAHHSAFVNHPAISSHAHPRHALLCQYNILYELLEIQQQLQYMIATPLSIYARDKPLQRAMSMLQNVIRVVDERPYRRAFRLQFCKGLYQVDVEKRASELEWEKQQKAKRKQGLSPAGKKQPLLGNVDASVDRTADLLHTTSLDAASPSTPTTSADIRGFGTSPSRRPQKQCPLTAFAADPLYDRRLVHMMFSFLFPADPVSSLNEEQPQLDDVTT